MLQSEPQALVEGPVKSIVTAAHPSRTLSPVKNLLLRATSEPVVHIEIS
jgi:hypothetical protein